MSQNFLKQVRQEKGVKASELARLIGVSRQSIYGYERGVGISSEILLKLSNALDVSANYILTGQEDKSEGLIKSQYLSLAMEMAYESYFDESFDREELIKISAEIYNLMINQEKIKNNNDKENFQKSLEDNIIKGLAAKCFLENSCIKSHL